MFRRSVARLSPVVLGFVGFLFLAGCAGDNEDFYLEQPVEQLYNRAMELMADGSYAQAARFFLEVERQHPYSVWATKAQLMSAFAYYQYNQYSDAIPALDRFIQLHPGHKDVAYAYYLKALCYYEQIADVARDQSATNEAVKALQQVIDRFPTSRYAGDAKLKIDLSRDHLAGKEMNIGRWYEKQHLYLAAINRYRTVVDNYQTTTHVPEALHRLDECYEALGLGDEAKKVAAVLGYNYPGSPWYADIYNLVTGAHRPAVGDDSSWYDFNWLF